MKNATTDRNPKLTRRLKRALLATLFGVLVLATIAAAVSAYFEASETQDDTLRSVARLVRSNQLILQSEPRAYKQDDFDDSEVTIWELGKRSKRGIDVKRDLSLGFHTVFSNDDLWRVFITEAPEQAGKRYAVAQKLSVSGEFALNSAISTAWPLVCLFLLVPLLISLVVRHSFKPLNELTEKITKNDSLQLELPEDNNIPIEVLPFVSSIRSLLEKNQTYNLRQRRFIADAAHELRTPITALSLEIENVNGVVDSATREQRLSALGKSIQRLQRLVSQLLELARAQSIDTDTLAAVSLNDLLRQQIEELYPLIEQKSLELAVNRNEPLLVYDRQHQLQHLLRNALSNAIRYAPESGHINVDVYASDDNAVFDVTDDGPGVDEAHLAKLHEPFFRPDSDSKRMGAGLGLSICHEIAISLKGHLLLSNVSPNGFRFSYRQAIVLQK